MLELMRPAPVLSGGLNGSSTVEKAGDTVNADESTLEDIFQGIGVTKPVQ